MSLNLTACHDCHITFVAFYIYFQICIAIKLKQQCFHCKQNKQELYIKEDNVGQCEFIKLIKLYLCSRKGSDAGDHPPITPMRSATEGELGGDAFRLYDYITRHFIGTVSATGDNKCCSHIYIKYNIINDIIYSTIYSIIYNIIYKAIYSIIYL